jgi:hypothetical protein
MPPTPGSVPLSYLLGLLSLPRYLFLSKNDANADGCVQGAQ